MPNRFINKSGLLEFGYKFVDVEKPNLFRDMYTYDEIPKLVFNRRMVPMDLQEDIFITDTTFRDGQQARSPYTVQQVTDLFTLLHKLDNGSGIIRQTEFFLYSEKNREAVRKCQELGYEFPEITAWIRARKEDFQLVKEMGLKETGILVSCSDYHIFKKFKWTRKEALKNYLAIVIDALEAGIRPRCHFEDLTRADFFGFVLPFAEELMKLMEQYKIPIKIRACDTLGLGSPFSGVVLPRSVPQIMYNLKNLAGVPSHLLEWHGHNDFYNTVPNAVAAWLYGAAAVNTSLLGIGERTGNTPLEAMCIEYCQLKGNTGGMDLKVITQIAEYFEKELNYQIPPRTPFVGRAFNSTRAGIHADGLMKDEEIYNIFNTTDILGRPPIVVVDSTSGAAGIAAWINTYFSLENEQKIDKHHECVLKIKSWVDQQYENGRDTAIGDLELENEVHKYYPELLKRHESRIE